jgi:AcrR family transcriptional regulator
MATTKRAYSEEAKQQREDEIIAAAEALLMEKGYNAINMDQVAQAAALAKGTVYLYFKSKEELFVTVFERQGRAWFDEIAQSLSHTPADSPKEALIDLLVHTIAHKPLLTRLVALSPMIFEYNISLERAREHKLWVFGGLAQIGQLLDEKFNLRPMQGVQLLFRTFVIVAGLEGFAHPSPISQQVYDSEPSLPKLDFEQELRSMLRILVNVGNE